MAISFCRDGKKRTEEHAIPSSSQIDLLRITYEDLTRNPEPILQQICTFLNINFEPGMLAFQFRKKYARDKEVMRQIGKGWTNRLQINE